MYHVINNNGIIMESLVHWDDERHLLVFIYLTFVHINKYNIRIKYTVNSAQGDPFGYKANLPRGPTIKLQQRRLSS